jgi:thiamine pyrophosphate-dependent acetolactate synthase large subunit-like protein
VHLEVPIDVLRTHATFDAAELDAPLAHYLPSGRAHADPAAVEEAGTLLARAERPLVVAEHRDARAAMLAAAGSPPP